MDLVIEPKKFLKHIRRNPLKIGNVVSMQWNHNGVCGGVSCDHLDKEEDISDLVNWISKADNLQHIKQITLHL